MRRLCFLPAFVVALSFVAPARVAAEEPKKDKSDNAGKIEGTKWSSVEGTVKGQKIPAGSLKLEFAKDGKLVYKVGPNTYTGTYELKAGDKVVFKLAQEVSGRKNHELKIALKDGKLTLSDPDGTPLDFEKTNEELKEGKSDNAGKIEGTKWSSLEGTVKGQKIPAGLLSLEFSKDGELVYKAGPTTYTGKYELRGGDKVLLKLDQELAGNKQHEQKIVIKDGKLTMTDSDGTSLDFEKTK